uniref:Uncharacterized protein n=1 Tax=Maylandia zebra TaxID=106582 RepID=A0A3P9C8S4_9CICH
PPPPPLRPGPAKPCLPYHHALNLLLNSFPAAKPPTSLHHTLMSPPSSSDDTHTFTFRKTQQKWNPSLNVLHISLRTAEENEALQHSGWIGLSRKDATSPWKWSRGGEIAIFTPWDGTFSYYVSYSLDVTRSNLLVIIPNLFAL